MKSKNCIVEIVVDNSQHGNLIRQQAKQILEEFYIRDRLWLV